jgi:hypothetical protein
VFIGFAEAHGFALFLGKGFHHADPRDGVGQHVGDLAPDAVDLLEAGAQLVAHDVDHPGDERQRHQGDEGQPRINREQDHPGHDDHQHVRQEVEQVQRQEDADAVRAAADPRHQVARALAAEEFQRELQQVLVGGRAQIGAHALRHQRQHIGLAPAEQPGQDRGAEQAAHVQVDEIGVDLLPVLVRDQDIVHQRHRQVRRNHVRAGAGEHQDEAEQQLALVGLGEAPQAEQGPGRGRRMQHLGADRAFFLVRLQRRLAARTGVLLGRLHRDAGGDAFHLVVEGVDDADRVQVLAQGEAPGRQQAVLVDQFEMADAGMVVVLQHQAGLEYPVAPDGFARRTGEQTACRYDKNSFDET